MGDASELAKMASFELTDLPDEILLIVMRLLDFDSLLDVVYVNKHFRELAEPFLYESITVLHGEKALNLSHSLAKDLRRPGWVRNLLISTKFGQEHALMKLPPSICLMNNLHELRLETPDCNAKKPEERVFWIALQDYYETVFCQSSLLVDQQPRLLPNLKSCVLHFVDTHMELYSLTRYSSIFLHPTLESLTISCMSTDHPAALYKDVPDIGLFKRSTALQHLHLEECDIDPPCLELLLSFPRALKSLKISEGIRYDGIFRAGSSRMHGNVRPNLFAQALVNTCKDSLESLSLALGFVRNHGREITHIGQYLKLQELEKLKYLEVNNRTLNLIRSRPNCDHLLWKRLPISLEVLKVFAIPLASPQHDAQQPYIPLLPCIVKEKQLHGLPNLKHIIYSYEHYESSDDEDMNFNDLLMNLVYHEANGNPPTATNDPQADANAHGGTNPLLDLLEQAVGAIDHQPPLPPPTPANFVAAAMNPNLDAPPPLLHPPRFRWRTGSPLNRQQQRPELSRSDTAKYALLNTIQGSMLDYFQQNDTLLQVDLVTLPRGFIPPYLFPEDKPRVQEAWYNSANPLTPTAFIEEIRKHREAARMQMRQNMRRTSNRDEESEYTSERARSRSRFMQRLEQAALAQPIIADSDDMDDVDVQDAMMAVLDPEHELAMLMGEVPVDSDDLLEDSGSESASEYLDASTEVEMSEADAEDDGESASEDDGDDDDEFFQYTFHGGQHTSQHQS